MGNQYSYFDHPEGEQCLYKTACMTRYSTAAALSLWWYDVVLYSKCRNAGEALARLPLHAVPFIACTATFFMTSCLLNQTRPSKDDSLNFTAGAVAAGTVLGACKRSGVVAWHSSLVFGFSTFVLRDMYNGGTVFFKDQHPIISRYEGLHDYTFKPDRPKYDGWEWK